jgi:hypothetical protein
VASIVPIAYLDLIRNDDYFLALAHVAEESKKYRNFFRDRAREGKFVILDNGAWEGGSLDIERLALLVEEMEATELILPDVLYSGAETLMKSYKAMVWLKDRGYNELSLMAVGQGLNVHEWDMCVAPMCSWSIDCIGIPKHIVKNVGPTARALCAKTLKKVPAFIERSVKDSIEVHLLGCWNDPMEVAWVRKEIRVRGADSAIAYSFAQEGLSFGEGDRPKKPIDFSDTKTNKKLLAENIKAWREESVR